MATPNIAQKSPFPIEVKAGKKYFWCACGKSQSQPFCDGSHRGSEFTPMSYDSEADQTLYFCGCKHSNGKPFCDGTHTTL